jgi:outer membrane protein
MKQRSLFSPMTRAMMMLLVAASACNLHAEEANPQSGGAVWPKSPPAGLGLPLPNLPERLTLQQAEDYALAHQPALAASQLRAEAETQRVYEARSQFFPQIQAESVLVKARDDDSRLAAIGGITNPTILSRQSDGGLLSQLITDFGRTYFLTTSARSSALSAAERTEFVRQTLLFRVDQAYFAAQGAQALLQVANQTVSTDQLLLERIKAMAGAKLKSSLDVDFQQVSESQAQLLQLQAQARLQEAFAELSAALGLGGKVDFTLAPMELDPVPPDEAGPLIAEAWAHRPDLLSARADRDAALRFAKAESAAHFPVISAQGGLGVSPGTVNKDLPPDYGAIGINVSVPVFTGGLLTANAREAALRAEATQKDLADAETEAARDVYNAWVEARTAYDAIAVSQQLVTSAEDAFKLAQSRYQVGASSIVELSQADLQRIQAEITAATSRFDYQVRRRALDFQMGTLK